MVSTKIAYAASAAITLSLAPAGVGLADGNARESASIDNTSNLYLDVLVQLQIKLAAGGPGNNKAIFVYAAGSEDGTAFTDNATGTDAAITLRAPTNLQRIGVILTPDSGALTYKSKPMSVAAAFGGVLPRKWSIIVQNKTGLAFDGTEGNHTKSYTGLTTTTT